MNINIEDIRFKLTQNLGELEASKIYRVSDLVEYIETLLSRNEELETEIKNLKDEIKDLEQDMEDNYRPVPVAEQIGISESDFI